jgi:hypothetical protein
VVLTDAGGKVLQTIHITQTSFTLDMSKFSAGLYFITTGDGKSQKIIKE